MNYRSAKNSGIILAGGGGHCKSLIDVLECAKMPIAGIVHGPDTEMRDVLGYPPLGRDGDLPALRKSFASALVSVGQIKSPAIRMRLFSLLRELDFNLPVVISPLAHVSKHAIAGAGSAIMHGAIVNSGAVVGENCIVNSRALLEHDCIVGNHCHISVGAVLCGGVKVGDGAFIGAGAVCRENVHIGKGAIIGMGAFVHKDIEPYAIFRGN